jgi:hypothetical protein
MSDDNSALETSLRLKHLIEDVELSRSDKALAERCMRRLAQPLRLTVFGTDPRHAISLINLMIGQPVVSPSIPRARIQFLYGETAHARLQFRDGSQTRLEGSEFRRLFDDNPSRVRIYVDLPVLKKLSILVASESNPVALCEDSDKTLPPADIALWSGAELSSEMVEVWNSIPDRLRDHSYLVLSPDMDMSSWKSIAQEFVEIMRVDPLRAQEAKEAKGGVDKEAFREAGGGKIVKTIKREIDLLTQSAFDAAEVLLLRYADQLPTVSAPATPEPGPEADAPEPEPNRVPTRVMREQVFSVPLGKLASRSRLVGYEEPKQQPKRTVSMAIKNMPKNPARPVSKTGSKPRPKSRRSRPGATPWSLGL